MKEDNIKKLTEFKSEFELIQSKNKIILDELTQMFYKSNDENIVYEMKEEILKLDKKMKNDIDEIKNNKEEYEVNDEHKYEFRSI